MKEKLVKPGVYFTEKVISIYSNITNMVYSSMEEYESDIRRMKLKKLEKINESR